MERKIYPFYIVLIVCIFLLQACSQGNDSEDYTQYNGSIATSAFKIWGNCGMCKETIEESLLTKGVIQSDWDSDSKIMHITYDTGLISLDQIKQRIASVGYDTKEFKGNDSAYHQLPKCCHYKRKE